MKIAAVAMAATLVATIAAIALGAAASGGGPVAVGGLAVTAVMLVAIGLFMIGFVGLVKGVNALGIKPSEVDAFTDLMTAAFISVAKFAGIMVLAAVGMVALAAIMGALAVFVAASIATAVMIRKGYPFVKTGIGFMVGTLAVISAAMPEIVTYLSKIVESINKIPFDAEKLALFFGTFAGIMLAVGTIAAGSLLLGLASLNPFAGAVLEKGLEVMQEFLDMIKEKIPPVITSILAAVSGANIEELKSKGEIAVKLIEALASMMQPLSAAVELTKDPGFFSRMAGATGTNLSGILTSLKTFILSIATVAAGFVYAIIRIVKNVPEEQLKKVNTAIQIIETLSTLTNNLMQSATAIATSGANPTEMHARMHVFKELLNVNSNFMKDLAKPDGPLKALVDDMIKIANGIKLGKNTRGNIDLIKNIVETTNSITNSIVGMGTPEMRTNVLIAQVMIPTITSSLNNIVPHILGFANVANKHFGSGVNLKAANNLLAFLGKTENIIEAVGIVGNKAGVYSTAYANLIPTMYNLMNIMPHMIKFADETNKHFGSGVNPEAANNLLAFLGKTENIVEAAGIVGNKAQGYSTAYNSLIPAMSILNKIMPHMLVFATATNAYFGEGVNLKGANNLLAFMDKADDIVTAMGMIGRKTEDYSTAYTESIKDSISGAIDAMYELNEMLNDIHLKPIDVVVEDFAEKMLTSRTVGIENKPINIHMRMNLKIDAEEITKATLRTTAKLMKRNNVTASELLDPDARNFKGL